MKPLHERPGYEESGFLVSDLRKLRERHQLVGAVLITFSTDRVGVNSTGITDEFAKHMQRLADRILAALDDGKFDPEDEGEPQPPLPSPPSGEGKDA